MCILLSIYRAETLFQRVASEVGLLERVDVPRVRLAEVIQHRVTALSEPRIGVEHRRQYEFDVARFGEANVGRQQIVQHTHEQPFDLTVVAVIVSADGAAVIVHIDENELCEQMVSKHLRLPSVQFIARFFAVLFERAHLRRALCVVHFGVQ